MDYINNILFLHVLVIDTASAGNSFSISVLIFLFELWFNSEQFYDDTELILKSPFLSFKLLFSGLIVGLAFKKKNMDDEPVFVDEEPPTTYFDPNDPSIGIKNNL